MIQYRKKFLLDTIRDVAEASARIRDLVRAVRQSGAIDEVSTAVQEAVVAARDGTKVKLPKR